MAIMQALMRRPSQVLRYRQILIGAPSTSSERFFDMNYFSTQSSSASSSPSSGSSQGNRVPITLYRQLLGWCRAHKDVPFEMPPLTLTPPLVSPSALKHLKGMRALLNASDAKESTSEIRDHSHPAHFALYNDDVDVRDNILVFPEIKDADELRELIRSVYWLNNSKTLATIEMEKNELADDDVKVSSKAQKEQISLAFDAIRSCNEMSSSELDNRKKKRQQSIEARQRKVLSSNNEGKPESESHMADISTQEEFVPLVEYHVGQVVQHKKNKWRGVIVDWKVEEVISNDQSPRLTSLTTKNYSSNQSKEEKNNGVISESNGDSTNKVKPKVKYTVLLDVNDATLLHSSKFVSLESQDDLRPVRDPCLQRIHSSIIKQYFTKFDTRGYFVPNKVLSYMYPMDHHFDTSKFETNEGETSDCIDGNNVFDNANAVGQVLSSSSEELEQSCLAVIIGVQEISKKLLLSISHVKHQNPTDQDFGQPESLASTLAFDIQSMIIEVNPNKIPEQPLRTAISLLEKLYRLHLKIGALLWTRKIHLQHKSRINFSLGEIVEHKVYGFRGVVVAWDHKPYMDVSNWDGLKDIENVNEKPFYHIRPDINDCIRAFGGPRNFRYVCQDNLEAWTSSGMYGEVEFESELDSKHWRWDNKSRTYTPSEEMKFMYAEDLGENEEVLTSSIESLRKTLADCLLQIREVIGSDVFFSKDDLFLLLKSAENIEDATIVQDLLKEIWKESTNEVLRNQLDSGIADLLEGKNESALEIFSSIVEDDATYGEAWNKKATVHYMMGEMQESLAAAKEALEIEPRNFQALAGVGLVEMDTYRIDNAADAFRRSLALNPWSMVSARLSVCLSRMKEKDVPKHSDWPWNREST